EKRFWGLVAGAALVLSLGTGVRLARDGSQLPIPLPYLSLYTHLPGFGALRVPARWGMLVALALAVLAAVAIGRVRSPFAAGKQALVGLTVLVAILIEQASLPLAMTDPRLLQRVPPVYSWLGAPEQRDIAVVLELPVGRIPRGSELDRIIRRQFYQMYHWKALPVAYSGLIPFGATDLLGKVQALPDPEALRYLQLVGVDTLVVHRDEYDPQKLKRLLAAFATSPLLRHRAEVA